MPTLNVQRVAAFPGAWAEIDLAALNHNFLELKILANRNKTPQNFCNVEVMPVLKADAYGHGMSECAQSLSRVGLTWVAISNVDEAVALRRSGITSAILVMESVFPEQADTIVEYQLTPTVCDKTFAEALDRSARRAGCVLPVHVKVDTGMGRLGIAPHDTLGFLTWLRGLSHLKLDGLFTHFPNADVSSTSTDRQIAEFRALLDALNKEGIHIPHIHMANSAGMGLYPNAYCDVVRPGLMLYGLYPAPRLRKIISLKPVMAVKARVLMVKSVEPGQGVSYAHTFTAEAPMKTATLAIGYQDGYDRSLSNRAEVLLSGKRCRVLGRVTMDQIIVDVTHVDSVSVGDEAVVLGSDGEASISADELAAWAGTISYEIVCQLGHNLPKKFCS